MGGPCLVDGIQRAELDNFLDTDAQFELDGELPSNPPPAAPQSIRGARDRWHTALRFADLSSCSFNRRAGKVWTNVEQYYQAAKFPEHEGHRETIRACRDGYECWRLGNRGPSSSATIPYAGLPAGWQERKVLVMYRCNYAKFSQNADLRGVLLSTTGPITAFGSQFWAKWNAIILERTREELRPTASQNARVIAERVEWMDQCDAIVGTTATTAAASSLVVTVSPPPAAGHDAGH
jgi:predicted NAD-dependent protein-ADP-ribosyltransferase YbiA (DUF1768 family)